MIWRWVFFFSCAFSSALLSERASALDSDSVSASLAFKAAAEVPEIKNIYEGMIGKMHGEANEKTPAPKAVQRSIERTNGSILYQAIGGLGVGRGGNGGGVGPGGRGSG